MGPLQVRRWISQLALAAGLGREGGIWGVQHGIADQPDTVNRRRLLLRGPG
jgi:hypothetical protein